MTDETLHRELAALGVDKDSWRAVLLLPVVQVAWADGAIQAPERVQILQMAHEHGLLDSSAGEVVRQWLDVPPNQETLARGERVLVALIGRHRGPGADLGEHAVHEIQERCQQVARAAGGLFDLVFTVDEAEEKALAHISKVLSRAADADLDDLPSPAGGRFTDL